MSATITGTITDPSGFSISTQVDFVSLSTPLIFTGGIISPTSTDSLISDANGNFTINLIAGNYQVNVYATESTVAFSFNISVPSSGTYTIDQITTSSVTYVYQVTPSFLSSLTVNPIGGATTLVSGASSGAVTYSLPLPPTSVLISVESNTGTENIFATLVGDPTASGFSFSLSAMTDTADYKLRYTLFPTGVFNSGTVALGSGVTTFSVTGLGLLFTPSSVILTVEMPNSGGTNMFANIVGDPTSDGFSGNISVSTPGTGYKVHYAIFP